MSDRIYDVLFVCIHDAARSILAEGLMNSLAGSRFKAFSAAATRAAPSTGGAENAGRHAHPDRWL